MADVIIQEQRGWGIATLMARRGVSAERIGALLDIPLPGPLCVAAVGTTYVVSTGPATWLALSTAAREGWADSLASRLSGFASVSEQSAGYALLAISGGDACRALQAATFLDLRDGAFPAGRAAATVVGYIGITLWRPPQQTLYFVAVYRSYLASFNACMKTLVTTL